MNKQIFLAELRRFLPYMSEEDRDKTTACLDELFAAVGEGGEIALMAKLGSPTKTAIDIGRAFQAGGLDKALEPYRTMEISQFRNPAAPEKPGPEEPMQQLEQEIFSDLPVFELQDPENMELIPKNDSAESPDFEIPDIPLPEVPSHSAPAAEDAPAAPEASTPAAEPAAPAVPVTPSAPAAPTVPVSPAASAAPTAPVMPAAPAAPTAPVSPAATIAPTAPVMPAAPAVQPAPAMPSANQPRHAAPQETAKKEPLAGAVVPKGVGIPMFMFIMLVLGLPLAFLFLLAMVVILVPGCAGIGGAYLAAVACLWSVNYVADTILLIGAALVLLALGVIVLFGGIWLDIQLVIVYKQAVTWLGGALIGRRLKR